MWAHRSLASRDRDNAPARAGAGPAVVAQALTTAPNTCACGGGCTRCRPEAEPAAAPALPLIQRQPVDEDDEQAKVEPPPVDFNYSGLLGPVYRDLFGGRFIGLQPGEALQYDPSLALKGNEFTSAYTLGLSLLPPAINEGLELRPRFGEEGFEAYESYIKGMGPLSPSGTKDFAGGLIDVMSLTGGVRIGDYFGSELFLKHRLWPYLNADWGLFRALGLIGAAQGVVSAGYGISEELRDEEREPDEMITPPWLTHLTVPKFLLDQGLKAPVFKPPGVFSGLGPLTAPTYPASAYSHFADEAVPGEGKLEYEESADTTGSKLSLDLPVNLSGLLALGDENAPGLSEQADLAKYRGGQLGLWGRYQHNRPTASEAAAGKLPSRYAEGGILGGYGGHTGLFEGGARFGDEGVQSRFLRGGYSFSGAAGSPLKEIGLTGTWLDWSAGATEGGSGGEPGSALRLTPFVSFGDLLSSKEHELSLGAAASVALQGNDPDLAMMRLGLAYTRHRLDESGEPATTGLPAWSLGGAFSMARPQWWNPAMPYLYGAQLKGNVGNFFMGTQFHIGEERLSDEQAAAIGIEPDQRKQFELLLNLGWNLESLYGRSRQGR